MNYNHSYNKLAINIFGVKIIIIISDKNTTWIYLYSLYQTIPKLYIAIYNYQNIFYFRNVKRYKIGTYNIFAFFSIVKAFIGSKPTPLVKIKEFFYNN